MYQRIWIVCRSLMRIVIGLLLLAVNGLVLLWDAAYWAGWFQSRFGDVFYVHENYLARAVIYAALGGAGLTLTLYPLFRSKARSWWWAAAWGTTIFACVFVVDDVSRRHHNPHDFVSFSMGGMWVALSAWGDEHGRLPKDQQELEDALTDWIADARSVYGRNGRRLWYQVHLIPEATGPHLTLPSPPRPAVVYVAVSPDLTRVWMTGTNLGRFIGRADAVGFATVRDSPYVVSRTLEPR